MTQLIRCSWWSQLVWSQCWRYLIVVACAATHVNVHLVFLENLVIWCSWAFLALGLHQVWNSPLLCLHYLLVHQILLSNILACCWVVWEKVSVEIISISLSLCRARHTWAWCGCCSFAEPLRASWNPPFTSANFGVFQILELCSSGTLSACIFRT